MASKQRLKKEIDYIVSDLILDCFTYTGLHQKPNDEEVLQIVQDTLVLRNELRQQVNHPEKKSESQTVKNFFDNIAKSLLEGVDNGYQKLEKLMIKED